MQRVTNIRYELFAQRVAAGEKPAQAYESIWEKEPSEATRTGAARLLKNATVSQRIAELQVKVAQRTVSNVAVSKEAVLQQLWSIATSSRNDSAKVSALTLVGKELRMFVDRSEVVTQDIGSDLDLTRLTWDELQMFRALQAKASRHPSIEARLEQASYAIAPVVDVTATAD